MEEILAQELADARERIEELEADIDALEEVARNQESANGDELQEAFNAREVVTGPLRRLLAMIDDGRLVLVDPLFTLELRDARDALRNVS